MIKYSDSGSKQWEVGRPYTQYATEETFEIVNNNLIFHQSTSSVGLNSFDKSGDLNWALKRTEDHWEGSPSDGVVIGSDVYNRDAQTNKYDASTLIESKYPKGYYYSKTFDSDNMTLQNVSINYKLNSSNAEIEVRAISCNKDFSLKNIVVNGASPPCNDLKKVVYSQDYNSYNSTVKNISSSGISGNHTAFVITFNKKDFVPVDYTPKIKELKAIGNSSK